MKNTLTYLAALFLIISFSACQKGIDDTIIQSGTSSGSNQSQVKTYTEDLTSAGVHTVTTFNLSYDGNGKLDSMASTTNPGDKFVYKYNSNNSFTMDLYNSNVLSIHEIFYLNNLSLVDSTLQYNSTKDTSTEKYLYNSVKQLVTLNEYDYTSTTGSVLYDKHTYTYDNNGNAITDSDLTSTITYDYFTSLSNTVLIGPSYFYQNKNLTKTTTYKSGSQTEILNHTYTFDSNNRLSTEKIIDSTTGDVLIKTYTY